MKKIKFMYVRLFVYIATLLILFFVYTGKIELKCYFYDIYNLLCPGCGLTRATLSIINFNFKDAVMYNRFFTCVLVPLAFIFIIDDVYVIFKRLLLNKKSISLVEIILGENKVE